MVIALSETDNESVEYKEARKMIKKIKWKQEDRNKMNEESDTSDNSITVH